MDYQLIRQVERRLEDESGAIRKEAPFRLLLCYPSPYHVGMSSLGFQIIYREVNRQPGWSAERAFLPDDLEAYRRTRSPLFSYERQADAPSFQVLAFSVAYELELTGLLAMLELSGLSPLRESRPTGAPLVVAGGPLTFSNPEPLEPFVDLVVQGEAEGLLPRLLQAVSDRGGDKERVRAELAELPGFRAPGLSSARSRLHVQRAPDQALPGYSQLLTPHTELRSMFLIEPERGCSRGCHYCVMRRSPDAGMRTVPLERVLELVPDSARRVGLVGAAVTDHPGITELIERLVEQGREVGVSSLRADRLSQRLVQALRAGGAKVLTLASDGASQRLRDLVERKHSEEQILRAARWAKEAGMERLKLYQMLGLPTEEEADLEELIRFSLELSRILPLALGVSPFVAKRHTPLDGAPFAGIPELEARLEQLRRGLRGKAEIRPASARWAWVEYLLAQSGPEAGLAAHDAYRAGGSFAAWKRAFEERGVRPSLVRT